MIVLLFVVGIDQQGAMAFYNDIIGEGASPKTRL